MNQHNQPTIYWSLLSHNSWSIYIAATSTGLCFVGAQNGTLADLTQWTEKNYPGSNFEENSKILNQYMTEIMEYLDGKRTSFTTQFDFKGTNFQQSVWKALCEIPYGQTKTYSEIAQAIDKPSAVRAVGGAIGKNPILILVPCHRVIGKNGSLTGFRGGLTMKTKLLDLEKGL
jgi:methylated-DNA-[protein]-cysteine S-methyltransferase